MFETYYLKNMFFPIVIFRDQDLEHESANIFFFLSHIIAKKNNYN